MCKAKNGSTRKLLQMSASALPKLPKKAGVQRRF
jgi:hypothetical protein